MQALAKLIWRALLCCVALLTLMTMHECVHWLMGWAAGAGPFFRSPSTVGYRGHLTDLQQLAIADIPVVFVFVVGLLAAWLLLSRHRERLPEWLGYVLVWWAVCGLAYPGDEAMVAPLGHCFQSSDFACVADWFGWTPPVRSLVAALGAVWYLASGWFVVLPGGAGPVRITARMIPRALAALVTLLMILALASGLRVLARGGSFRPLSVLTLWAAVCALAIPWTRRSANRLLTGWLMPLVLAEMAFFAWNYFQPSEFVLYPVIALAPLFSALWRNAVASDPAPYCLS